MGGNLIEFEALLFGLPGDLKKDNVITRVCYVIMKPTNLTNIL